MEINQNYLTAGIRFTSFITINRHLDKRILKDSKLFILMLYISLRVKRSNKIEYNNWDGVNLDIGEFIIGRISTIQETDLTEAEYRSRISKLQTLKVIGNLQPTNKYTKGKWLENSFIDVNLEHPINQPDNQQVSNESTTNNKTNNTNNLKYTLSLFVFTNNQLDDFTIVLKAYMYLKGIELKGIEIKDAALIVKKMFDSERTSAEIIKFMKWLKERENSEDYPWVRSWTISTIQKKLPEFLAGKLRLPMLGDDLPSL